MSTYAYQRPIIRLRCDAAGCDAEFQAAAPYDAETGLGTRFAASQAGWDVFPARGKGSRGSTDYCPRHAKEDR